MPGLSTNNGARLRTIFRTFPATLFIVAVILIVAGITASGSVARHRLLVDGVGLDLHKVLHLQLWTLPVSTLVQSTPGIGIPLAILVVVALALLEYLAGSWRAAVTFFLSDWISAPLTILVAWPLAHLGLERADAVLYRPDTGSSAAAFGAFAAALVFLPSRWRAVSAAILFTTLLCLLPSPGLSANIAHLLGALTGFLLGLCWRGALARQHQPDERLVAARSADALSQKGPIVQSPRLLPPGHVLWSIPARSRQQLPADSHGIDE